MARNVSITLQNNDDARGIIEAVKADNPNAEISEFPSMVKIDSPGRLVINKDTVEDQIGREWDVQELQLSLISLAGEVDEEDEYFALEWRQ
jgi:phenol hydroxylase P2 protein